MKYFVQIYLKILYKRAMCKGSDVTINRHPLENCGLFVEDGTARQ